MFTPVMHLNVDQLAMLLAAHQSSAAAAASADMARYRSATSEGADIIDVDARFVDDVPQLPAPDVGSDV